MHADSIAIRIMIPEYPVPINYFADERKKNCEDSFQSWTRKQ